MEDHGLSVSLVITSCPVLHELSCPHHLWHEPCRFVSPWLEARAADGHQGGGWSWALSLVSLPVSTVSAFMSVLPGPAWLGFPQATLGTPLLGRRGATGETYYRKPCGGRGNRHRCSESAALGSSGERRFCFCPRG